MKKIKKLFSPILLVFVLLFFFQGTSNLKNDKREEERLQLQETLRKAAVACYAAEGAYPPDIEYLKEHYGIRIQEKKYRVIYEPIASNLMPDITVLEITYEERTKGI